jgi:hypothetical protein
MPSAEWHRSTPAAAQVSGANVASRRRGVSAARLYETAVWEKARGLSPLFWAGCPGVSVW